MTPLYAARIRALLSALVLLAACGDASAGRGGAAVDTTGLRALAVPAEFQRGAELFRATCVVCHGEAALGTDRGPPLVHPVYEPGHHADAAFVLAVVRGVRAHHWRFGDMPPQPRLSRFEVEEIVGYVRWLQREAGVY